MNYQTISGDSAATIGKAFGITSDLVEIREDDNRISITAHGNSGLASICTKFGGGVELTITSRDLNLQITFIIDADDRICGYEQAWNIYGPSGEKKAIEIDNPVSNYVRGMAQKTLQACRQYIAV